MVQQMLYRNVVHECCTEKRTRGVCDLKLLVVAGGVGGRFVAISGVQTTCPHLRMLIAPAHAEQCRPWWRGWAGSYVTIGVQNMLPHFAIYSATRDQTQKEPFQQITQSLKIKVHIN